jgi:hypothetical protein
MENGVRGGLVLAEPVRYCGLRCRPSSHDSRRTCRCRPGWAKQGRLGLATSFDVGAVAPAFADTSANAELRHDTASCTLTDSLRLRLAPRLLCSGRGTPVTLRIEELRRRYPAAQAEWSNSGGTSWGIAGPDRPQTGGDPGPRGGDISRRGNRAISAWE